MLIHIKNDDHIVPAISEKKDIDTEHTVLKETYGNHSAQGATETDDEFTANTLNMKIDYHKAPVAKDTDGDIMVHANYISKGNIGDMKDLVNYIVSK